MARPRFVVIFCAVLALGLTVVAQEKITLSVAETKPSNAEYRIERLTLQYDDPASASSDEGAIVIALLGQNSEPISCVYNATSSPTATFLINALNKANLSSVYAGNATTGSLKQRVCHRLIPMGESTVICGKTITGSCTGAVP